MAQSGDGERKPLRVIGVDALAVASVAPALMPVPREGADRFAVFAPDTVFLNPAARQALAPPAGQQALRLQSGLPAARRCGGRHRGGRRRPAGGDGHRRGAGFVRPPRPAHAHRRAAARGRGPRGLRALAATACRAWSRQNLATPRSASSNLSRAYRVNLTVLALVALFTGAFLVFSVLSLSVARRAQQFALLGVLGLTSGQRLRLVLAESLLLGVVGSIMGIALGTGLADLASAGAGRRPGRRLFLRRGPGPAMEQRRGCGLRACSVQPLRWPADGCLRSRRSALPLAQTLKGLGSGLAGARGHAFGLMLIACAGLLALLPPVQGIPLAAYLSVGFLLVGGITVLPWAVALLYDRIAPCVAQPPAAAACRRARTPGARERGGGGQRRGGFLEPGGRAHGDGGELSRFGDPLAGCGAAGGPVPAHGTVHAGRRHSLVLARLRAGSRTNARRETGRGAAQPLAAAGSRASRP